MAPLVTFGTQVCATLPAGAQREWLVADGCGGYAMGTVSGLRTRRYHGLLVVSLGPLAHRRMGLVSLDPVLVGPGGDPVRLATHEWASGAVDPTGYRLLASVRIRGGLPVWRWRVGPLVLERELAMATGSASVAVSHRLIAGPPTQLVVEPICTWRDAHGEGFDGGTLRVEPVADGFVVEGAYRVTGPGYTHDPLLLREVYAREEAARGLAATEDLLRTGRFQARLEPGEALEVSAWAGSSPELARRPPPARDVIAVAVARRAAIAAAVPDAVGATLALAADACIVRGGSGPDVVAGYPWFGAWSRDTMIAYPGLFLATGRADEGRALLAAYSSTLSDGMLANTADGGHPEYNAADATLWLLHAVGAHVAATGDTDLAAQLVDALDGVVAAHVTGTRFGLRVDPADGLLSQGADGLALTWMDAIVDDRPVTPRAGKAVELNALWVNGLAALGDLHRRLGRDAGELDRLRSAATSAVVDRYASPRGGLFDVVDAPDGDDDSVRPNQLLAVGLPYAPLRHHPLAASVVSTVAGRLLTPLGLRTLDPGAPAYLGRHRGNPAQRDRAYHQGTVWPWLVGPYADAVAAARGVGGTGEVAPSPVDDLLDGLVAHLGDFGVGSVSETADGDAPHEATGCPFQAWSVAELLRTWRGGGGW
jgi:predicted glycogen debranching enzyme